MNGLNILVVGLGEMKVSSDPKDVLVAYGLGSCLGIGMYDPVARLGGFLHAILPANPNGMVGQPSKYVDTGIMALLDQLTRQGGDRRRLVIRMAGGANILTSPGFSQALNIGSRNADAARAVLASLDLKISGEEVGGKSGRTVRFYIKDGQMTIRTIGNQERAI